MQQRLSTLSFIGIIIFIALVFSMLFTKNVRQERIEKLYQITKNDPLFFDYTLDTVKFNKALSELKSKENAFLRRRRIYLSELDKDIFEPGWRLFPIEFLEKLDEVSAATNAFLESPSFLKARGLVNLQKKTLESYGAAAQMQLESINRIIERNPLYEVREIRFLESATTLGIVKNDFELILENAKALEEEIARREKCLFYGECPKEIPNYKSQVTSYKLENREVALLPLDIIAPFEDYDAVQGPYFVETGCFGFNDDGTPKTQAFYLFEKDGRVFPKLATQNYYIDLEFWRGRLFAADIFLNRGARQYMSQSATNDYRCSDLTYWASLFDNQLSVLPNFIQETASHIDSLISTQQITQQASDSLYLMTARINHSIFFLPFSSSVWLIEESPQYILKKNFSLPRGITTYTSLRQEGFSDEKIKTFRFAGQSEILKEYADKNQVNFLDILRSILFIKPADSKR